MLLKLFLAKDFFFHQPFVSFLLFFDLFILFSLFVILLLLSSMLEILILVESVIVVIGDILLFYFWCVHYFHGHWLITFSDFIDLSLLLPQLFHMPSSINLYYYLCTLQNSWSFSSYFFFIYRYILFLSSLLAYSSLTIR